jgi:hypothetical protein
LRYFLAQIRAPVCSLSPPMPGHAGKMRGPYRDVVGMMAERGVKVAHSTILAGYVRRPNSRHAEKIDGAPVIMTGTIKSMRAVKLVGPQTTPRALWSARN